MAMVYLDSDLVILREIMMRYQRRNMFGNSRQMTAGEDADLFVETLERTIFYIHETVAAS